MADLRLRRYDPRDSDAVWQLHERAMRAAGTDPADIPGTEDLRTIEASYLDAGGDFIVGICEAESTAAALPDTFDGVLVTMGGFLPSEAGHDDERTVPGAAELHRMRTAPALQGQGVGRQLLAALERRARAAGFERALATTAHRQQRAVAFYRAADYREVDRSNFGEYELVHFEKLLEQPE
jgi:GNAT superfamily N-acetyltransferase